MEPSALRAPAVPIIGDSGTIASATSPRTPTFVDRLTSGHALVIALVATLIVHGMVLSSWFKDDDYLYLYSCHAMDLGEFLITRFAGHFQGTTKLVWAGMHALFGIDATLFFCVVLATHLAHVALMFCIVRALTKRVYVALATCVLWGCSPALHGTMLWFSTYGMMLSATAILWALFEITRAIETRTPVGMWALVRINIALVLGAGTMLVGTVSSAVFPLTAWLITPPDLRRWRTALSLLPGSVLSVLIVVGAAGAVSHNIPRAVMLFGELIAHGVGVVVAAPLVTVHAEYAVYPGVGLVERLPAEVAVALSAACTLPLLGLLLWRLIRGAPQERRLLLGLLIVASSIYGAIAAGRSSGFIRDLATVATTSRYHYAPSVAIAIAIGVLVAQIRPVLFRFSQARVVAVAAGGLIFVGLSTFVSAKTYSAHEKWSHDWMRLTEAAIRGAAKKAPDGKTAYILNDRFKPVQRVIRMGVPRDQFPGVGAYWIIAHGTESVDGRVIRFVVENAKLLETIKTEQRQEVAAMFVSPEDAARDGARVLSIYNDGPPRVATALRNLRSPRRLRWITRRAEKRRAEAASNADGDRDEMAEALRRSKDPEVRSAMRKARRDRARMREAVRKRLTPKGRREMRKAILE